MSICVIFIHGEPLNHVHYVYIYIYIHMSIDLKVLVLAFYIKWFEHVSAKDPRWVRERKAKNRESCCVIDLGRIGLVRYMLYQSVGIQVANSLSRHATI